MFEQIRENKNFVVATSIIGLLITCFLFGLFSYLYLLDMTNEGIQQHRKKMKQSSYLYDNIDYAAKNHITYFIKG